MQNQSKESPQPPYLCGMAIALHMRKVSCSPQSPSFLGHVVLKRGVSVSQRFGHPRVLGIPIPKSLAFWASPVGDTQNADRFDFA